MVVLFVVAFIYAFSLDLDHCVTLSTLLLAPIVPG